MQALYPPMPMIAPRPDRFLRMASLLLLIFLLVGLLAGHAAVFVRFRGSSDPTVILQIGLFVTFYVMMDVALALMVFMTLWTLAKPDASEATRRGLILFTAVFFAVWIFLSTMSPFGPGLP